MPKFKDSGLYSKLILVEKFVPPLKRFHEALESVAESVEYILFVLKEMEPEITHLEKNVNKLKANITILEDSLERHGFKIEETEKEAN